MLLVISSPALHAPNPLETQKITILGRNHAIDCMSSSQPPATHPSEVNTTQGASTQQSASVDQFAERFVLF